MSVGDAPPTEKSPNESSGDTQSEETRNFVVAKWRPTYVERLGAVPVSVGRVEQDIWRHLLARILLMSHPAGSITCLIPKLRRRDELAIEAIWQRYIDRIRWAARPVIAGLSPGGGDDEDVAQSAFHAFCETAATDRLPPIESRNELWRLLLTITRRKAVDRLRRERRLRRGGGTAVVVDAVAVDHTCDRASSPVQIAELQEAFDRLMRKVAATRDHSLTEIARLRLEGFDNQEIARQLGCAVRTIQRKLNLLERIWTEHS